MTNEERYEAIDRHPSSYHTKEPTVPTDPAFQTYEVKLVSEMTVTVIAPDESTARQAASDYADDPINEPDTWWAIAWSDVVTLVEEDEVDIVVTSPGREAVDPSEAPDAVEIARQAWYRQGRVFS
jgi:hypothetical protein